MRGGQHQTVLLMSGLRTAGHENILLARREGLLAPAVARADFEVHSANLMNMWHFSRVSDVVHAHDAHGHTLAALASRGKFVVSRRVAFPLGTSAASRWKYRRAKRFLAVSQYVAGELLAAGIPNASIDIVHDAVECVTGDASWTESGPVVALASSDPQKGRSLVEEAANRTGIAVRFSNELRKDLAGASMFVYISHSEGLGSGALVAMSMGVPVIASRVGGLPEVVEDGVTGLLVENNADQIGAAMKRLATHAELARRLGEVGRRRVAAEFTPERLVSETLDCYRRAIDG